MAEHQSTRLALTVHEVAQELRVSDRTVWNLIRTGELPSIKVAGSRRVVRDSLNAYLAKLAS